MVGRRGSKGLAHATPGPVPMQFDDLKSALQPTMSADLDALYKEFVDARGSGDLMAFMTHLHRQELITRDALHEFVKIKTTGGDDLSSVAARNTGNRPAPGPTPQVASAFASIDPAKLGDLKAGQTMVPDDDDDFEADFPAPKPSSTGSTPPPPPAGLSGKTATP